MSATLDLVRDRFAVGWYFPVEDRVLLDDDPELGPLYPLCYTPTGFPVYAPLSRVNGMPTLVCPRCMQPSWAITKHAAEVHGDPDVTVLPPRPGKKPPEWFHPDWV